MDSLSEATFTSVVSALAQRAKEGRNQALRQGALDKTDNNWMSAALLEHTYNSILGGDKSAAQHISKKLMGWMNGMEMICMDQEIQNRSTIAGSEWKDHIIDCPSCKTKYKVPTNRHIEVTCKNCKYKWKIHT